eukprot:scaffold2122_cov122-Cylindrotheca_fusiformis.AAC.3
MREEKINKRHQLPSIGKLLQPHIFLCFLLLVRSTAIRPSVDSVGVPNSNALLHNDTHRTTISRSVQAIRGGEKRPSAVMEGLKNSMASALASCCAKTLLQPFDTIKTVQQHSKSDTAIGFFEAIHMIMDREGGLGFMGLYAGLAISALGSVPAIGLYYGMYSYCKRILIPLFQGLYGSTSTNDKTRPLLSDQSLKLIAVAISAAVGNCVASVSRVPYEVVKQKLQTGQYSSTIVAISSMFQAHGLSAFFPMGGVAIQMIRDIPYAIFTLLSYEYLRDVWANKDQKVWKDMVVGGTAGGFGAYMTNGLDVIKTRLQTSPELYNGSVLVCAKLTYQEGGITAFLRGSTSRLLHKIPANGMFFVFFEFFKRLLLVDAASLGDDTTSPATSKKGKHEKAKTKKARR